MSLLERAHQLHHVGRRKRVLAARLDPLLAEGSRVLDVGAGDGLLARTIADRRPDLRMEGVDLKVREHTHVPVGPFDGEHLPQPAGSYDAVLLVDVLHHAAEPRALLREAARVARRHVVLKDHTLRGPLAGATLRFMDRVSNERHGVPLLFQYWTPSQWEAAFRELGLQVERWEERLGLYPFALRWLFERRLHFVARLRVA